MALPPTIPTSFVPKQALPTQTRRPRAQNGVFYYVSLFVMVVALVGAAATFGLKTYLDTVKTAREMRLETVEQGVDSSAVEELVRLRNRIKVATLILNRHVVASQFLDTLEEITLQNVRFQSLQLSIADDRTATIDMRGTARSFNALAAQSAAFADQKEIRRAIFSGIAADKNGLVKFAVQAELLPKLITEAPSAQAAEAPAPAVNVATTTPFEPSVPAATTTSAAVSTTTP